MTRSFHILIQTLSDGLFLGAVPCSFQKMTSPHPVSKFPSERWGKPRNQEEDDFVQVKLPKKSLSLDDSSERTRIDSVDEEKTQLDPKRRQRDTGKTACSSITSPSSVAPVSSLHGPTGSTTPIASIQSHEVESGGQNNL